MSAWSVLPLLENRLAMYGISLSAIQADEITQVLAHMVYDEQAEEIAVVGLSLGAGHAASQAIINSDVVDAVVVASGVASHVNSPISHQATGRGQLSVLRYQRWRCNNSAQAHVCVIWQKRDRIILVGSQHKPHRELPQGCLSTARCGEKSLLLRPRWRASSIMWIQSSTFLGLTLDR